MGLLLVLLLAALQGLTEFLPISSSGHLRLLQLAFGVEDAQTAVDVVLHVGTLFAVVAFYRREVSRILVSLARSVRRLLGGRGAGLLRDETDTRLALLLVVGTLPAGVVGVVAKDFLEGGLMTAGAIGALLLVNGVILILGGRTRVARGLDEGRPLETLGVRDALLIGTAQAFAILRGISRSGSTISAAVLLGVRREDAARFSFLLSIPAILGAAVLELPRLGASGPGGLALVLGALTAGVVGWVALRLLLRVVRAGRLDAFAWYCWALGGAAIVWSLL